jgi:hypothetical protein
MSCEGRERAKGRERGPPEGQLRARGGAGIGKGQACAARGCFAHLSESRPIAYQDVTHVNIMRSAPAAPLRCAAQSAGDAAPVSPRNRLALNDTRQAKSARSQRKSAQVRGWKSQGNQGLAPSQGRVRGWNRSREPPRGSVGGGQDDFDTLTGRQPEIFGDTRKTLPRKILRTKNFFAVISAA